MPNSLGQIPPQYQLNRLRAKHFLCYVLLIVGGVFLSWFLFDHFLLYMKTKITEPEIAVDVGRLIAGLLFFVMGVILLKWDQLRFPSL